jgi:P27 family predicted phage terminase small subunit
MKKSLPPPPAHLSIEAKAWWRKIVEQWDLDDPALLILEGALEAFDRMRQAQAIIAEQGVTTKDRFKQVKQHPATLVERDAKAALLRGIKALGLDLEPINPGPGRPLGGKR